MALVVIKTAATALAINYGTNIVTSIAYNKLCVPQDIWGLAQSIVATASPVCTTLLNIMQFTQNNFAVVMSTSLITGIKTMIG